MTKKLIFILTLFVVVISCDNVQKNEQTSQLVSETAKQNGLINNPSENFEIIEVNCDSIYNDKGISIRLVSVDKKTNNEPEFKFLFLVIKQQNGQQAEIFRDTIESTIQEVKFADFNNDNVKDILIQNISDVRGNLTYNLYIVDKNLNSARNIKGFEEIKNPKYLPKYDLIDNLVMSGRNWTSFYKIVGDTIKAFNIVIYEGKDENGKATYDSDYKRAIKKIFKNEKNSL